MCDFEQAFIVFEGKISFKETIPLMEWNDRREYKLLYLEKIRI